jgi:glycosyltransferase involved in cell wall biosynthesis
VLAATVALAGATIANSASTAATIPRPLRHRVAVIHPGVDTNRFSPGPPVPSVRHTLAGDSDEPVVAIVGRVDPDKGVDIVVDAVARLNNSGLPVRLAVVGATAFGHDDWRVALGEMAEARLGDRAVFTDVRHDIPDVLRSADILVNASYNEPFGRSVLEAQACGTPVIGTDAGGIPEFVKAGCTGLLVPPGDGAALAAAIRRLLCRPELTADLSQRALTQATIHFSAAAHAAAVGALYRRLAARR